MADKKGEYDIGYGKPPKHSQFKPGQSGNQEGRRKGGKNLKTDLQDELNERIAVIVNGRTIKVTKQQAFIKTLTAQAIQGNPKAASLFFSMLMKVLPQQEEVESDIELTETDQAILNDFVAAIKGAQNAEVTADD